MERQAFDLRVEQVKARAHGRWTQVLQALGVDEKVQQFEIERIWLLVIIDVFSRAVLGYHVSLNREYSR